MCVCLYEISLTGYHNIHIFSSFFLNSRSARWQNVTQTHHRKNSFTQILTADLVSTALYAYQLFWGQPSYFNGDLPSVHIYLLEKFVCFL